jgi:hypothetical protein
VAAPVALLGAMGVLPEQKEEVVRHNTIIDV